MKKITAVFSALLIMFTLVSCSGGEKVKTKFSDTSKISISTTYSEIKQHGKNSTETWRQGMVSGNGMQGFITSGSPSSDSIIYQNMHFIMPNQNIRTNHDVASELEPVKQAIVKGEDITDNANYEDVYSYHPGGALRIQPTMYGKARDYYRFTQYTSAQVGVCYTDSEGEWTRTSYTVHGENVNLTKISMSDRGKKASVSLSFDDISAMANFGNGNEVDMKYKKLVDTDNNCLAFVAHYPEYEQTELKNGGYASVVYIITDGQVSKESLGENTDAQFVGENDGIFVKNATKIYLIAKSDRDTEMGTMEEFVSAKSYALVDRLLADCKAVEKKYQAEEGGFDESAIYMAHLAEFGNAYAAVELNLEGADDYTDNETLIKAQRRSKKLLPAMLQKAYENGRYAYLCCAGYSTPRLYGMWTGEFATGWGSKYTMDANVNLQTSSMNTSNISFAPKGYISFILRQLPDWLDNAKATHGYEDSLQAPVNTDGDSAILNETCYPYPFRYWNAGTSWMISPMYETLLTYGDMKVELNNEFSLEKLKKVLDLDDAKIAKIEKQGYMMLEEDILLPILKKSVNYWLNLVSYEYYTNSKGEIKYEKGKKSLADDEYFAIVPSYTPENNPSNYASPSDANCTIDISACRDNIKMLQRVCADLGEKYDKRADELLEKLPPYLYDETGALKEWATTSFDENNEHRHLSHLYVAWPMRETQTDSELKAACIQAIANRASENSASHALVHRSLIDARLGDKDELTKSLLALMRSKIYYNSLMTNHNFKRNSCYCTDYTIGYLGIINESLVYSEEGKIVLLPSKLTSGMATGSISGLALEGQVTLKKLEWKNGLQSVSATLKSAIDQTVTVSVGQKGEVRTVELKAGEDKIITFEKDR